MYFVINEAATSAFIMFTDGNLHRLDLQLMRLDDTKLHHVEGGTEHFIIIKLINIVPGHNMECIFLAGRAGYFCKIDTASNVLRDGDSMTLEHEQDSRAIVYCKDIGKFGTIVVASHNGQITVINPIEFEKKYTING